MSYRVAAKSIERVADHASSIADQAMKLEEKISEKSLQKIDKMSHLALTLLGDSVGALLHAITSLQIRQLTMQKIFGLLKMTS